MTIKKKLSTAYQYCRRGENTLTNAKVLYLQNKQGVTLGLLSYQTIYKYLLMSRLSGVLTSFRLISVHTNGLTNSG